MGDARREAGPSRSPAGILFGFGLGGFFDGVAPHQVLQWQRLLTNAISPDDGVAKRPLPV